MFVWKDFSGVLNGYHSHLGFIILYVGGQKGLEKR